MKTTRKEMSPSRCHADGIPPWRRGQPPFLSVGWSQQGGRYTSPDVRGVANPVAGEGPFLGETRAGSYPRSNLATATDVDTDRLQEEGKIVMAANLAAAPAFFGL